MTNPWLRAAMVFAAIQLMTACSRPAPPPRCEERYGIEATPPDPLVTMAVAVADEVLSVDGRRRLVLTPPAGEGVQVAMAPTDVASPRELAWTADRQCVFVAQTWRSRLEDLVGSQRATALEVEPEAALAIALLHEIGHVDRAADAALPDLDVAEVESAGVDTRHPELACDIRAAQLVARAARPGSPAFGSGMRLVRAVTNIGWNLQTRRQLDTFGSLLLGTPEVFGDNGYSHPNLELRFLVISHRLSPSDSSRQLLEQFLSARRRGR